MFKLNLKIALRNLFKNKVYAAINIGGLAIGLTAFVLLLLFMNHEDEYDKWNPNLKNVYQIREYHDFSTPDNKQYWQEINDTRTATIIREKIPQFSAVTKVDERSDTHFSLKTAHADPVMVRNVKDADSLFFKVFPYQFLWGDRLTALNVPKSIVLKQSLAIQLFGTDKVLGKEIKVMEWRDDKGTSLTITGVVADPSGPESVAFTGIMRTGWLDKDPIQANSSHYAKVYALADQAIDTTLVNSSIQKAYVDFKKASFTNQKITYADFYKNGKIPGLKAIPLHSVHANPPFQVSWVAQIKPIVLLSIFLLLISIINFVNLATAQATQRAKEVGVKKVMGAHKKQLLTQFLLESAVQTLAALFVSIVLVEVLLPSFNHHFNVELSFWQSGQLLGITTQLVILFLLITLLAGFYPAIILSNYNPVSVLKGNYEHSFKGLALRNGLVVFQFIIAVTFITGIGVMHLQTRYITNKDLGFSRDKLINISTNYTNGGAFTEKVKRIPGVRYVATTTQVIGNAFNVPQEITYKNQDYPVNSVTVTMEALPALGVQVVQGRIFSEAYKQDQINSVVLNEAAAKLIGKQVVGEQITQNNGKAALQVIGVIKDYHSEGFEKAVLPTIYKVTYLGGMSSSNNMLIRFETTNYKGILSAIEAEWKKIYPNFPMQYTSAEDAFQASFKSTGRLMQIVVLFSIISIILSLFGLFALSTFLAKRRTKEIAIRKIMGASNLQLINMLNRSFLILVVIANLISWPIAYILTKKWLDGFAYRIDMPVLPFVMATLISIIIAIITVSLQARKATLNNPVDALKYE